MKIVTRFVTRYIQGKGYEYFKKLKEREEPSLLEWLRKKVTVAILLSGPKRK